MKQFKLKRNGIILILVLILALVGGGVYWGLNSGLIENDVGKPNQTVTDPVNSQTPADATTPPASNDIEGEVLTFDKTTDDTINISLDEWIG